MTYVPLVSQAREIEVTDDLTLDQADKEEKAFWWCNEDVNVIAGREKKPPKRGRE